MSSGVFWSSYAVIALAVPAFVVTLRLGGQLPRTLGLLYCAAGITLGYALVLGTLEEQELYLLAVPSLLIIAGGRHAHGRCEPGPERAYGGKIPRGGAYWGDHLTACCLSSAPTSGHVCSGCGNRMTRLSRCSNTYRCISRPAPGSEQ